MWFERYLAKTAELLFTVRILSCASVLDNLAVDKRPIGIHMILVTVGNVQKEHSSTERTH